MKQYSEDSYICTAGTKHISLSEYINILHDAMQYLDNDMVGNFRGLLDILSAAIKYRTDTITSEITKEDTDKYTSTIFELRPQYDDEITRVIMMVYDHLRDQPAFIIKVKNISYKLESDATGNQAAKCYNLLGKLSGLFEHPEFVKVSLGYKIDQYKKRIETE